MFNFKKSDFKFFQWVHMANFSMPLHQLELSNKLADVTWKKY